MPTSCIFSTDLHSMGQFLQDGSRVMFETYVDIKEPREDYFIPELEGNFDGLNFLANQNMSIVNRKAMEGTILAHTDGGVPLGVIEVDRLDAYNVGALIYFFWKACARVPGICSRSIRLTSPALKATRRTCSRCWANPVTRPRKLNWKPN